MPVSRAARPRLPSRAMASNSSRAPRSGTRWASGVRGASAPPLTPFPSVSLITSAYVLIATRVLVNAVGAGHRGGHAHPRSRGPAPAHRRPDQRAPTRAELVRHRHGHRHRGHGRRCPAGRRAGGARSMRGGVGAVGAAPGGVAGRARRALGRPCRPGPGAPPRSGRRSLLRMSGDGAARGRPGPSRRGGRRRGGRRAVGGGLGRRPAGRGGHPVPDDHPAPRRPA